MLEFKLDLDNIDGLFPIDFQPPRTKNQKLFFFKQNSRIFVTFRHVFCIGWVKNRSSQGKKESII